MNGTKIAEVLWLWFSRTYPLLVLALAVGQVLIHARPNLFGDEWRYLWYATHLTHGYFSPTDNPVILNGPGYPLVLAPFVAAGAKTICAKLLNAALFAAAVVYVRRTLLLYTSSDRAAVGGLLFAVWPLPWQYLHLLYTEALALFLVCGLFFHFCAGARDLRPRAHAVIAGIFLGALVMTKVSFAGPMQLALVTACGLWLIGRRSRLIKNACVVTLLGFALCVPWLIYTQHVSGRWLYWTSGIGQQAYWISTPFPEERGDWFHQGWVANEPLLQAHHGDVYRRLIGDPLATAGTELDRAMPGLGKLWGIEADSAFLKLAVEQVREHPLAYARNWVFNVGRLFFDYPYTFSRPIDLRLALPHVLLLGVLGYVCTNWARGRIAIAPELRVVAYFTFVATLLGTLLSAHIRFFVPFFPGYFLLVMVGTAPEAVQEPDRSDARQATG